MRAQRLTLFAVAVTTLSGQTAADPTGYFEGVASKAEMGGMGTLTMWMETDRRMAAIFNATKAPRKISGRCYLFIKDNEMRWRC